jgi:oligopeptide/dipeptide ABC transporter ATP-binding protein
MYAGRIVERGRNQDIFGNAQHPYTRALIAAAPSIKKSVSDQHVEWTIMGGDLPDPENLPDGCRFHPRCKFVEEVCRHEPPPLKTLDGTHVVECHVFPN